MKQWNPENTASSVPTNVPPGAQNVRVFVEPRDQKAPIIDAIKEATSSILLEMYELTDVHMDPTVVNALVTAAKNNVKVQVMLFKDAYRFFRPPTPSYDDVTRLLSAGQPLLQVQENLANLGPRSIKHQKFMVIDDTAAYIMTANLSSSALGGNNREYIVRDTDPQDILALQNLFLADWNGNPVSPSLLSNAPDLVVSPINSFDMLKAMIDSAQTSLYLETEEFNDHDIGQALINAVKRPGVQEVKLILPPLPPPPLSPQNQKCADTINFIRRGGVSVKTNALYYMHAKLIIVDGKKAFVGSQNLSTESLKYNREVGIIVSNKDVVDTLSTTFASDWASFAKPGTTR